MKYKEKNKKGKNIWSKFEQPTVVKSVLFTRFKFSWVEHSHFETPARAPRKKKMSLKVLFQGSIPVCLGDFRPLEIIANRMQIISAGSRIKVMDGL